MFLFFFSVRERAEFNKSCNLISSGAGGIFSSGSLTAGESARARTIALELEHKVSGRSG